MSETKTTRTASFGLNLQNNNQPNDTTTRTISFDVAETVHAGMVESAASLFSAASLSSVFQPTSWRDSEGTEDVYILTSIEPELTEKTVTKLDPVTVQNAAQENP